MEIASAVFLLSISGCYLLARRLRQNLYDVVTGDNDIPNLRQALPDTDKLDGTAVICGGSLAGLLAARVCHNYFKRVVIIEPEPWLATEEAIVTQAWTQRHDRSRIIQYHSVQAQQALNLKVYRALFPDFDEEAKISGVKIAPADLKMCIAGHFPLTPYHEYPGGLPETCFTSRQGIETLIRRLVLDSTKYPNIEFVTGAATGYHADPENPMVLDKVIAVSGGETVEFNANLILDCTGGFHTGVKLLKKAGYGFAETYPKGKLSLEDIQISYDPKMYYSTIELTIPPALAKRLPIPGGIDSHPSIAMCLSNRKSPTTLYFIGIDGPYRIHISPGAWDIAALPKTIEGVKEFAHSMTTDVPLPDWIFEMLDMLIEDPEVQASMAVSYLRVPPSYYYRFDHAVNLPSNWVALGDSVMRINPVFGTGIAKIAYGVISLNKSLRTISLSRGGGFVIPPDFAAKFFSTQKARIDSFWTTVKSADYAQPTTVPIPGEDKKAGSWARWYVRRLRMLSFTDNEASSLFWRIANYLAPGIDAIHPRFLFKVLLHYVRNPNM